MDTPTLYETLKAAGCELDNHETDLYVRSTETSRRIVREYRTEASHPVHTSSFTSTNGEPWIEAAFLFDPAWRKA